MVRISHLLTTSPSRYLPIRYLVAPLIAAHLTAQPGAAQQERYTSSYLPLGHWGYEVVDLLAARGRLEGLPQLNRPYRRVDLARSLLAAEERGSLLPEERRWVELLMQELGYEARLVQEGADQDLRFGGEFEAGLKGVSHEHRDLLRPKGDRALWPVLELRLLGDAPNVAGAFRMRWDGIYLNDPQFPGGRAIPARECDPLVARCAYRVEEGYVEAQLPYVRLFFGRLYRNWGMAGTEGFLISDYAYSYDHVGYWFGSSRLALSGLFTLLNDFPGDTARYFSAHRLDWQVRDNLALGFSEAVVYAGVGRKLDLNLTNPVGIYEISPSADAETNTMGALEVWWRPKPRLVTYGALLIDNTRVGEPNEAEGLTQWGLHLAAQLPQVTPRLAARADFSVVNSLAYRSRVDRSFFYTFQGLSLGRDKSDAVIGSIQLTWLKGSDRPDGSDRSGGSQRLGGVSWLRPGLLALEPRLQVMWRGEDDVRKPWPDDAFTGHDLLLVGRVETTVRPSLAGRWVSPHGELKWDLGVNWIKNLGNQPNGWQAKFVGRVQLSVRARL
ncbi:MAG: hypothetical protein KatS3mg081_0055 [Gemmatimonadales bacterium]|nr:MAG: hypothetical protein KatS3mg081_0055 [Gemmatimonadales bacterium]